MHVQPRQGPADPSSGNNTTLLRTSTPCNYQEKKQQKKDTSAAKTATKSGLACAVCAPLQGVYVQVLRGGTLLVPVCGFFFCPGAGKFIDLFEDTR